MAANVLGKDGKPVVVVFTANSNTGTAAVETLGKDYIDAVSVRAIVRKQAKGDHVKDLPNVTVMEGDIARPKILQPVFTRSDTAYFSTPATKDRVKLGKAFVDCCIEYGIPYGIICSAVGAETQATELLKQMFEIEEYARSFAGKPVKMEQFDKGRTFFCPIILRCGFFYQNMYGCLAGIKKGELYYPLGTGKMPHVDVNDIGKCIAKILSNPAPHGNKTYNLICEYQAGNQIASNISMKASCSCKYVEVDDKTAIAAFTALGYPAWVATGVVELLRWYREGNGQEYPRDDIEAILGKPATRFPAFVKESLKPMLA